LQRRSGRGKGECVESSRRPVGAAREGEGFWDESVVWGVARAVAGRYGVIPRLRVFRDLEVVLYHIGDTPTRPVATTQPLITALGVPRP
jgi:hypothetical protein